MPACRSRRRCSPRYSPPRSRAIPCRASRSRPTRWPPRRRLPSASAASRSDPRTCSTAPAMGAARRVVAHARGDRMSLPNTLVTGLAALLASLAHAADTPLTLAEAQRLALGRSQLVVAQDAAVAAAKESAVAAGQLKDPVLRLGLDNFPVSGPDAGSFTKDSMTMARIGVMQEWTSA